LYVLKCPPSWRAFCIQLLLLTSVLLNGCSTAIKQSPSDETVQEYKRIASVELIDIYSANITVKNIVVGKKYLISSFNPEPKCIKVETIKSINHYQLFYDKVISEKQRLVLGRTYIENLSKPYEYKIHYQVLDENKCKK